MKIQTIYQKLRQAEKENRTIYIGGAVGYGKTAAVNYFYRNKPVRRLSGKIGCFAEMPKAKDITEQIILFDDISWVTDPDSRDYIRKMATESEKHILLIGRSALPA